MPVKGRARCWNPDCGEEVNVTENANGTLSMRCDFCALSVYGVVGAPVREAIERTMQPIKAPARAESSTFSVPAPAGAESSTSHVPAPARAESSTSTVPAPAKPARRSMLNPFGGLA